MEMLLQLIKNKRKVNLVILAVLTLVLVVLVCAQYFSSTPQPEGAFRVVKCSGCGDQGVKQIIDVDDRSDPKCTCGKCGKALGYAFKCDNCDFEFPLIPIDRPSASEMSKMKTMGKFKYVLQTRKCPNCGSTSTTPISVENKP
jgi:ribosomal protein S27E